MIRAMWAAGGPAVRVDGEYHRVRGVHPGPAPAHDVGIWVGAYKKRMLGLTGRLGDGWLPSSSYAPPEALPAMTRIIDEAAVDAGRRPSDVRRLYNITGTFAARGTGFLQGPAGMWAEQLTELTLTQGMSGYIVMGDDPDVIRRFAAEVAPAVRELVDVERSRSTPSSAAPAPAATPVPSTRGENPAHGIRAHGIPTTPDDGVRRSDVRVWDESTRPTVPPPDTDRVYAAHEQAAGRHLVEVHDHLRAELAKVRSLIDEVTAGTMDPGAARSHINLMTMRQNNWTLGAYCESYCRFVTTHHTLEDQSVFPHLRRRDALLAPVIDRLEEEHHAIHDVLEGVDRALVALVTEPDGIRALHAAMDLLTDTLLSHLSYEERELVEPLARFGFY